MSELNLSLAVAEYDHVRDLASGAVRPSGIRLNVVHSEIEDILIRNHWFHECDIAETGLGAYVVAVAAEKKEVVAMPVFPSRTFRHSAIFVHGCWNRNAGAAAGETRRRAGVGHGRGHLATWHA